MLCLCVDLLRAPQASCRWLHGLSQHAIGFPGCCTPGLATVRALTRAPFFVILAAGFVNVDSEKMSKSLGNFFTIRCGRTVAFWLLHSWGDRIFLALPHFSVAAMTQPSPDVPTCCACCCSCCSPLLRLQGSGGAVPPAGAALVPGEHSVPPAHQLHAAGPGGGGCRKRQLFLALDGSPLPAMARNTAALCLPVPQLDALDPGQPSSLNDSATLSWFAGL